MLTDIHIEGFRSVRAARLRLAPVTVVLGANGTGKTNLYQALRLLQAAASGSLARTIADAGGMPSVLWAGARRKGAVRLRVAATIDGFTYELALGLPTPTEVVFATDPLVKEERIRFDGALLLDRARRSAKLRDARVALLPPLASAVDRVMPGARLDVADGATVRLEAPALRRPLDARELSDGTLRYLCLAAALLSPRSPPLLALNEPETSLHESVLPALAELMAGMPRETQLWVALARGGARRARRADHRAGEGGRRDAGRGSWPRRGGGRRGCGCVSAPELRKARRKREEPRHGTSGKVWSATSYWSR